ncbi:MAG: tetratricopeptide repeat protein [Lewinella sp.]
MNLYDRLKNNDLSEQEEDEVFGVFIRRYEEDQLKLKWAGILKEKYELVRPEEHLRTVPTTRRRWLWPSVAAACLAGLLFVCMNLWLKPSGEQLIAEQIDQVQLIQSRSITQPQGELAEVRDGFETTFQMQDWEEAISLGDRLLAQDAVPSNDLLHVAFVNLQLANYKEAAQLLEELLTRNDILNVEARFYLGVSQLADGNIDAGIVTLEKIGPEAGEKYHQRAQEMLSVSYAKD